MKKFSLYQVLPLGFGLIILSLLPVSADPVPEIVPVFNDATSPTHLSADYKITGLNGEAYPGYPSFETSPFTPYGAWPSAIHPAGASTVSLSKPTSTDGSAFLSLASYGGGIYSFDTNTGYKISQASALANLTSLTFQVYTTNTTPAPSLTLTFASGSRVVIGGTAQSVLYPTSVMLFGMPTTLNDLSYTWDLGDYSSSGITGYEITWNTGLHAVTYGTDVTEVSTQAVPEPSTWAMMIAGSALLIGLGYRHARHAII